MLIEAQERIIADIAAAAGLQGIETVRPHSEHYFGIGEIAAIVLEHAETVINIAATVISTYAATRPVRIKVDGVTQSVDQGASAEDVAKRLKDSAR